MNITTSSFYYDEHAQFTRYTTESPQGHSQQDFTQQTSNRQRFKEFYCSVRPFDAVYLVNSGRSTDSPSSCPVF